ncbi:MAG: hypothetical protein ACE37F_03605 [Nannocystaceae bacterium]|nr:hypothetical protein [bacterium]
MLNNARTPWVALTWSALLSVATAACDTSDPPDPIIGSWESKERVGAEYNELEIGDDLEGEATIYFFVGDAGYFADFDVVADPEGGGDYELEFDCIGGCNDLSFKAECELDGDELECEARGDWESYEFEWELQS